MAELAEEIGWTLILFELEQVAPAATEFSRFARLATECMEILGVAPTHVGASTQSCSGKYARIGGSSATEWEKRQYVDIVSMSVAASPTERPGYDAVAEAHFSWQRPGELSLGFSVREQVATLVGASSDAVLHRILGWRTWSFGYAIRGVHKRTALYAVGASDGQLPRQSQLALDRWYQVSARERALRPRDVYPVNIWNSQQLTASTGGPTLESVLRAARGVQFERVGDLTVVKVPPGEIPALRTELAARGLLIAPDSCADLGA